MAPSNRLVRASKHLSYLLRHHPEAGQLELDEHGWADVDAILRALARGGHALSPADLDQLVQTNDKKRFELAEGRIRAAQGHSIEVDLQLEARTPPAVLFHGTVMRFLEAIRTQGLVPGQRQYVHLSEDWKTAELVGARRGKPVVLTVDARGMAADSAVFYRASNGVWLTGAVPPRWLVGSSER